MMQVCMYMFICGWPHCAYTCMCIYMYILINGKFIYECDFELLNFLDTTVNKGQMFQTTGILDVKIHLKYLHLYAHCTSYYPEVCKKV